MNNNNKNIIDKENLFLLEVDTIDRIIHCHLNIQKNKWSISLYKQILQQAKQVIQKYSDYTFICELPQWAHKHHHSLIKRIGFSFTSKSFNKENELIDIYVLTDKQKLFK